MIRPLLFPCLAAMAAIFAPQVNAQIAVSDNFDDGDDSGWLPINPIGTGSFTFPSGGYRLQTSATPNPAFGPGRAGSERPDADYTDFVISVDLVDWDNGISDNVMGILARVSNPGLGTTNGYSFTYTVAGTFDITRIEAEGGTNLADAPAILDPSFDYRLVFSGSGDVLRGQAFNLNDLNNPIVDFSTTDSMYANGTSGLFVFDNSDTGDQTADATFDNFSAIPEPGGAFGIFAAAGIALLRRTRRK